jgi:hypothetical protein
MTLTTAALARFAQCGYKHLLVDIEGVPLPPSTRQAVSRAVRKAIQLELCGGAIQAEGGAGRQSTPTPPQSRQNAPGSIASIVDGEMATVALTPQESARGMRSVTDKVEYSTRRLFGLWNSVVRPRIDFTHLNRPFELGLGGAVITGHIEIMGATSIRATKVRTRRPEVGEAERDLGLILQAIAAGAETVTVDYLIESDKRLAVDRQTFALTAGQVESTRERVKAAAAAIEMGVFLPADTSDWRCISCPLRAVCRYV